MDEISYVFHGTEYTFSPATPEEQGFCFSREGDSIDKACVGHLRGDFGSMGNAFYTSWFDHEKNLVTEEFSCELDNVINGLRKAGVLADRTVMQTQVYSTPAAIIKSQYRTEAAFRLETKDYLYFLRCIPMRGDYNFYCYAFQKERFYEIQRKQKKMPSHCWSRLKSTGEIVALRYGESGYYHTNVNVEPKEDAQKIVDFHNAKLNVSKAQVAAMEAGSMFGWHVPAADPRVYDENGLLKHAADKRRFFHER